MPLAPKNNLRLGSVVLQRADGRDAPALREVALQMARRGLNVAGAFDTFVPNAYVRGSRTYAVDVAGLEHMIARRVRGENRATKAGQRFHQMGYARYIVQVPTVYERLSTGAQNSPGPLSCHRRPARMERGTQRQRRARTSFQPAEPPVRRMGGQRSGATGSRAGFGIR